MDGSIHFTERTPDAKERPEQRLREPETINWKELTDILQQADVATEQLRIAHDAYIAATKAEHGRHPTAEQMQTSDAALAKEQDAYEKYAEAATKRQRAMDKLDYYMHEVHTAYHDATDLETMLLGRRHKLEAQLQQADGTVSLEVFRAIAEIDAQLPQLEADADIAYQRLGKVIDAYSTTLSSAPG